MNYFEQAVTYLTEQGVSRGLAITYIIVGCLLILMAIVALVMRIIVIVKYYKGNNRTIASGKTGIEVAREALEKAGLSDVNVEKAGWLRAFFIGNCYSITRNTIYLRRNIANEKTVTAVGLALQKVGIAKMCKQGSGMAKTRNIAQILTLVGPILFIPVVLFGFVLDVLIFHTFGIFSIVGIIIGLILIISGFVSTLLTLPVEKKANDIALEIINETGVLTTEEKEIIVDIFKAYIIAYVCEFIIAVLRIVQIVLEIAMNNQINNKK